MSAPDFGSVFGTRRPVIGVVHLAALPGAPGAGPLAETVRLALADAGVWCAAGADALIVENYGDHPFFPERVPRATLVAMGRVLEAVAGRVALPLGVNVLRNDAESAVALASAFALALVRINVHCGAALSDQGILHGRAHETLRLRESLPGHPLLFADLRVKHAVPLVARDLGEEALDLVHRARADALLLTGSATGRPADRQELTQLRSLLPGTPLLLASGVTPEAIAATAGDASGWIVGTYAQGGRTGDRPRPDLVEELCEARDRS